MALASILVGIASGLLSFMSALITGKGLLLAMVWYAGGGMIGALLMLAIALGRLAWLARRDAGYRLGHRPA